MEYKAGDTSPVGYVSPTGAARCVADAGVTADGPTLWDLNFRQIIVKVVAADVAVVVFYLRWWQLARTLVP